MTLMKNKILLIGSPGFTIIELLMVITIIGLLASIVLVSMQGLRAKARDAKRLSDMAAIQTAVEMYANTHDGEYFSTGGQLVCLGVSSSEQCWGGPSGNDALNAALAPYLAKIPTDPLYGDRIYGTYTYRSPGYYWLPAPIGGVTGAYSIAFVPDKFPNNENDCLRWQWASWDNPPPGPHCPSGGSCRHCGYMGY
jgi:prepilin-type N-terminal cleavage/methylation domain-containing protein